MAYGRGEGPGIGAGLLAALILALGIASAGAFLGDSLIKSRSADDTVTVRGLAERDVEADLAVWPMAVTAAGESLADVQADVDRQIGEVKAFLIAKGFDEGEIAVGRLRLEDRVAQSWGADKPSGGRYLLEQSIKVRSNNVNLVAKVTRETGELVRKNVALTGYTGASYVFTRLNVIKPDMLEQSTKNAREAAIKFAEHSGAKLGRIRTASQGLFEILPRDDIADERESEQIFKRVRVVSTVTYELGN